MVETAILQTLTRLYGDEQAQKTTESVLALMAKWRDQAPRYDEWVDEKTAYLITYGDSVFSGEEPPLHSLKRFSDQYLHGVISDIHLLPMFPYTSDDGFSVVDYREVDPALGDWSALNALSGSARLMYDCVINHISQQSAWFQGFLAGDERYQSYFVVADPEQDYSAVTRPRALPLLTPFEKASGERVHVWTTFSDDQIDINFKHPQVLLESIDILLMYAANGGRSIRLDAIGFIWKRLGTSCIHLEEAHLIIKLWRLILDHTIPGTLLITETNVPHRENIAYLGDGDEAHMVYQFPLPPLTLHAFLSQDTRVLTKWAKGLSTEAMANLDKGQKTTYFNFLASHDGIGVRPTEGLLSDQDRQMMSEQVLRKGGRVNYKNNPDGSQSPYELNINYLSALSEPDDSPERKSQIFLAAQAILLSFIGVPAIYYHSLLGSESDIDGMQRSGINRRINREKLDLDQLSLELSSEGSLRQRVYQSLSALLACRARYSAFSPCSAQRVLAFDNPALFGLQRGEGDSAIHFVVNVSDQVQVVDTALAGFDVITQCSKAAGFSLKPYEFVWLRATA